jgi:CubicO group peptidase (beta-lactamase class C family)
MKNYFTLLSVFLLTFSCASCTAVAESEQSSTEEIQAFEAGLRHKVVIAGEEGAMQLNDRMEHYKVPGVSIAVIDNGQISWQKARRTKSFLSN